MQKITVSEVHKRMGEHPFLFFFGAVFLIMFLFLVFPKLFGSSTSYIKGEEGTKLAKEATKKAENSLSVTPLPEIEPIDKATYDKKMIEIANNPPPSVPTTKIVKDPKTGKETTITIPAKVQAPNIWPPKAAYPIAGALLPFHRIIAYYGNLYSKKMGVLGQYPEDEMLAKLEGEVKKWNDADPKTPVIPALHYIAVVAQGSAGSDGKYRFRMPDSEIDKVIKMAAKINAIVFLDIQNGFSIVQAEIPIFEKYLKMPQVHLGLDPEFSMKTGIQPGKIVGTMDASDINFAANYLAKIVKENNLPPKILVVHRYTQKMLTNYKLIKTLSEVQIVIDMDGWGEQAKKIGTYQNFIYPEPVQFAGFKLFYKNDLLTKGTSLMTPATLLKLRPQPIYIQYQ
ncbi:MAG: hypothetical protein ABIS26_02325 [Candidatus Paceibacterota bacterium]